MRIFFVRHGQTEWNAVRRMQGQLNSSLNDLGRAQAETNGRLLANCDIEAMYVSPLHRTRETAEIIRHYVDAPIHYDNRIKEWHCGDWSGHLYEEVAVKWPREWSAWQADRFHYRGPGCENYPDMLERASPFLQEVTQSGSAAIAIVSHGMIGAVMMSTLLELTEPETLAIRQANEVVFRIDLPSRRPFHYIAGDGPFTGLPTSRG